MTPERQRLVEEVFLAAVEAGPEGWSRVVESRCGSDTELRAEVEGLLGCHQGEEGVLDRASPVGQSLLQGFEKVALGDVPMPPTGKIGHYKISRVLGAGGMGAVYVGEQDRPRRTVALKVIRPGYRSQQVLRRMEHEAELLGRLQHPGIAQIYEAGTADAWGQGPQPFFAMELVDGPPITDYCNSKNLGTRERLRLMAGVCDAVQHAHQRGVIHRDIKPGNILVGLDGQPKVLDFGVARATGNDLYVTTMQTSVGQMIGTLPYMSPEQVAADPDQVDTRTDVYSLGVVLYELLTGRLPHDVKNRPIPEAARVIRDESPARMSTVRKELRGEVETIVAKAMDKDKSRRYQSAVGLADDIRRYLAGEPINAQRDSAFYVLRKTLVRHKGVAALLGLIAVLMVGFAVYASVQASVQSEKAFGEMLARQRADSALLLARTESQKSELLNKELKARLNASVIERGRLEAVAENGSAAERFLWPALLSDPSDTGAMWALRELYSRYPCDWDVPAGSWITGLAEQDGVVVASDRFGTLTALTAGEGRTLGTWKVGPGDQPRALTCMTFIDKNLLAAFHYDGVGRVWSLLDGKFVEVFSWQAHLGIVGKCVVSPSGDRLATAGNDGVVRIWTLPGLTLERTIRAHEVETTSIAFSPDGRAIASGSRSGALRLWSLQTGGMQLNVQTGPVPVNAICYSADGRTVYTGGAMRYVSGWNVADGEPVVGLGASDGDMQALLAWKGSGEAQGEDDGFAVVGILSARVVNQMPEFRTRVLGFNAAGFSRAATDGRLLFTGSNDGRVRAWDTRTAPSQRTLRGFRSWVFGVDFSPDGSVVATTSGDAGLRLFNPRTGELIAETTIDGQPANYQINRLRARALKYLPSGVIVTGAQDGKLRFHSGSDGTVLGEVEASKSEIYSIAVRPGGTQIATVAVDGALRVWDSSTRKLVWETTKMPTFARGVAFSADGTKIYSGGENGGVTVWDAATHARIGFLPTSATPWGIAASPDGKRLGVGTIEAGVDVIDLETGERLGGVSGHVRVVAGVAFSPDSKLLFTGGDDGTVKIWEASKARLLSSIESHAGEVPGVAVSPDGRTLAYGCSVKRAFVRDLYYHDRHIAQNLEAALTMYAGKETPAANIQTLRKWAAEELKRAGKPVPPASALAK